MCPEERRQYVNLHYFNTFFHKVVALKSVPFKFHSSDLIFQYQRPILICAYYELKLLQEPRTVKPCTDIPTEVEIVLFQMGFTKVLRIMYLTSTIVVILYGNYL